MATGETEQPTSPQSPTQRPDTGRRAPVTTLVAIGVAASILGILLGILIDWFPTRASTQLDEIETVYDVLIAASVPMFVLVMAVVFYCVWKFRMKPGEEGLDGPPIHGNTRIEVIWTLIPALLMLALCTYSYIVLRDIEEAPANEAQELKVRVVGEQFTWTFFYDEDGRPGGKQLASAQLYLPIDQSVYFTVQSKDVLHDFWVPSFGMKIDAVPGIETGYRVTPNRLGTYPVVCAELCGLGHAVMRQSAHVVTAENFQTWLEELRSPDQGQQTGAGGEQRPGDINGKTLFTSVEPSCGACHVLADAEATGSTGPNLDESLKGKDADYIRRAIVDPDADIAQGFNGGIMPPNYEETLDPAEIDALVDYLVKATSG